MQIGFVNFNTEEKKRVAKMMQLLQESEAIEESLFQHPISRNLNPSTSCQVFCRDAFVILPYRFQEP